MANCPVLQNCPFFNDKLANMPTITGWLKKQYCTGEYSTCARYMLRQHAGPAAVPPDLFPDDRQHAKEIIQKHNSSS